MAREIKFGNRMMGDGHPAYVIAEIGINHNGDLDVAKKIIDGAVHAGADAVKFQKRTPEVSTPLEQQKVMRETPWGYITYLDYRYKVEFNEEQYREIDRYCKEKGIDWMVSVWDEPAVDFMEKFDTPAYKVPSASLTDHNLLKYVRQTGKPIIISTGMSTMEQIHKGVNAVGEDNLVIMHCTSTCLLYTSTFKVTVTCSLYDQTPLRFILNPQPACPFRDFSYPLCDSTRHGTLG